ncbi:hypothetical protein HYFRA_00013689 [Hymenoscyphus fraxineus]|uniref:Uncharacterized protein n=1 Tax=Hymenoscyphus fraxineus TaxID=746836 RepID=A0A9N9L9E7_9HELO|nr:hypothetical protein HYFRA_00013689 [Hymenoscyphus fraxineus]
MLFIRGCARVMSTTAKRSIMGEKLLALHTFGITPFIELPPRVQQAKQPTRGVNLKALHNLDAPEPKSELPQKMPKTESNERGNQGKHLETEKVQSLGMKMGRQEFDDMLHEFDLTEEAWNPMVEALGDVRPERNEKGETVTRRGSSCSLD